MPIYGEETRPDIIRILDPLQEGQALFYSAEFEAFTNRGTTLLSEYVNDLSNLGGANTVDVFSVKRGNTAYFRSLEAGANITLEQHENRIVITADTSTDIWSVEGDLRFVIDNNNDQPDAQFELWTATATEENPIFIKPSIVAPLVFRNLHTGITNGVSYFESDEVNFSVIGLRRGMFFRIEGTDYQDGDFTIHRIVNRTENGTMISRIETVEGFSGNQTCNLGGPKKESILTQADLLALPLSNSPEFNDLPLSNYQGSLNYELVSYSEDFGPNGHNLKPGMVVYLKNANESTGRYIIEKVFPRVNDFDLSSLVMSWTSPISGESGLIVDPTPKNPQIELEVKDFVEWTGFAVTKTGEIKSPTITTLEQRIEHLEAQVRALVNG